MRTRFAPSPTGPLHLGHAWSAHVAFQASRGGRFLIRIEDLDRVRSRNTFIESQLDDLSWLGFSADEKPLIQSARMACYQAALDRLIDRGLAYPCFCTRKAIEVEIAHSVSAPHGALGALYPGTCKALHADESRARIASGEAAAWRLDAVQARRLVGGLFWHEQDVGDQPVVPSAFGDVVLWRKDGSPAYHLAVVVDDDASGIELVTRGDDLRQSTPIHRLLQAALGLSVPVWHHHALVVDDGGKRLAKRSDSVALKVFREQGCAPADIIALAQSRLMKP